MSNRLLNVFTCLRYLQYSLQMFKLARHIILVSSEFEISTVVPLYFLFSLKTSLFLTCSVHRISSVHFKSTSSSFEVVTSTFKRLFHIYFIIKYLILHSSSSSAPYSLFLRLFSWLLIIFPVF